jgi:hypothetical protein
MDAPVYHAKFLFTERPSATLVVTCTSNAYSPYAREFLTQHLALAEGTYDYLSVPGGPQFLLLTEYLPKFAWAGQRWLKFLVERHRLKRAVLITHESCAWHDDDRMLPALVHRLAGRGPGSEAPIADLRRMMDTLREHLPGLAVEGYYAHKEPDDRVGFVRVS